MATNSYGPERNIFGRAGKVYRKRSDAGSNEPPEWLMNVTEITASMTIDRLEVRRAGSYFVQYKAGEITGEGTLTVDKVNSKFEEEFIDYINRTSTGTTSRELPTYYLHLELADPGQPEVEWNQAGDAIHGHEEIVLSGVNFWTMPFGFSIGDMVTRDLDFTFSGISFGATGDASKPKRKILED